MKRSTDEMTLLEFRQVIREEERILQQSTCIDLLFYKNLIRIKKLVKEEMINYRLGYKDQSSINRSKGG